MPGPLAPGRVVRCARCTTQWAPVPPPPVIEALPEPAANLPPPDLSAPPAPQLTPLAAAPAPPRASRLTLLLAWGGSVVLLVLLVAAALVWRDPIMRAWPPSTRLYTAIGFAAPQ